METNQSNKSRKSIFPCAMTNSPAKFHYNLLITFLSYLAHKQI